MKIQPQSARMSSKAFPCKICQELTHYAVISCDPNDTLFVSICSQTCMDKFKGVRQGTVERGLGPQHPWSIFHRLWTKAVGQPDYDKEEWKAIEKYIPGPEEEI